MSPAESRAYRSELDTLTEVQDHVPENWPLNLPPNAKFEGCMSTVETHDYHKCAPNCRYQEPEHDTIPAPAGPGFDQCPEEITTVGAIPKIVLVEKHQTTVHEATHALNKALNNYLACLVLGNVNVEQKRLAAVGDASIRVAECVSSMNVQLFIGTP